MGDTSKRMQGRATIVVLNTQPWPDLCLPNIFYISKGIKVIMWASLFKIHSKEMAPKVQKDARESNQSDTQSWPDLYVCQILIKYLKGYKLYGVNKIFPFIQGS